MLFDVKPILHTPGKRLEFQFELDLSDVEYLLRSKKNALTLLNGDGDFRSEECVNILNPNF